MSSDLFNIAMLYLADEMFKNRGKTFKVTFGKPIHWSTFDKTKTHTEWAQYVKDTVYKLNSKVTQVVKKGGIRNIVFNFSNLKSIDIKGINCIFYNYELCKNNEGRSLFCGNNDNIRNKYSQKYIILFILLTFFITFAFIKK